MRGNWWTYKATYKLLLLTTQHTAADQNKGGNSLSDRSMGAEQIIQRKKERAMAVIGTEERLRIARVRNAIEIIANMGRKLEPSLIMDIYTASLKLGASPKFMLHPHGLKTLQQLCLALTKDSNE